jgi:hypothetical protein
MNGLASRGLQVFLPISSKHMFVMFDGSTYAIGSKPSRNVNIYKKDVLKLNILQYLHANENLYFTHERQRSHVEEVQNKAHMYRIPPDERVDRRRATLDEAPRRDVVMINLRKTSYRLALDFVTLRKLSNQGLTPGLRNTYRYQIMKEFAEKTLEGSLSAEEFARFCQSHPPMRRVLPPTWSRLESV